MKLRYMVEYALRDRIREPRYDPIGVWVQGPSPGLDLVIEFLPGHAEAQEETEWVVNRLVENDVRSLPGTSWPTTSRRSRPTVHARGRRRDGRASDGRGLREVRAGTGRLRPHRLMSCRS